MKSIKIIVVAAILSFCLPAMAEVKPCEELKSEIAAKLDAKGVQNYTLEIVPAEQAGADQKVVGSCDGGKNKIVYTRGAKKSGE